MRGALAALGPPLRSVTIRACLRLRDSGTELFRKPGAVHVGPQEALTREMEALTEANMDDHGVVFAVQQFVVVATRQAA